jgi:hypothetical protein
MLRRHQIFEFCDQAWLPPIIREGYHDCLSFIYRVFQPNYRLIRPLADWAMHTGATEILDLASGGGEQISVLTKAATQQNVALPKFVMSDLFPEIDEWKLKQATRGAGKIGFIPQPMSALNIQSDIRHWTIFAAFHHFSPSDARKFLHEFVQKGDGLCIVEFPRRRWTDLIAISFLIAVLGLPSHWLVPFMARRFSWAKVLFATIIPVQPVIFSFDGIVSTLRQYTKDEIIAMLPPGASSQFEVGYREVWWRFMPLKATMLTLTRKKTG